MRRPSIIVSVLALTAAGLAAAACTMKKQEAPDLTGPSEFGTSITVQVSPDVITQDGASQSVVTITARDTNGQPLRNVALRVETWVNSSLVDFGTLSARTVVTGTDGRATLTYTAPPSSLSPTEQIVDIAVTPIGGDFNNAVPRTASLRLVPQGVVLPPSGLVPAFTFSPPAPVEDTTVFFDASTSKGNAVITGYTWNFGNGRTASGITATTSFEDPGSYFVTLTIKDEFGRTASTTSTVTVVAGTRPTAAFTYSPTDPIAGQDVFFNAAPSTVPSGRVIVEYDWDFGDGKSGSGQTPKNRYGLPRTYTVVLTVTDNTGQTATTSQTITVK
jgi:PKD repeat protein